MLIDIANWLIVASVVVLMTCGCIFTGPAAKLPGGR